MTTKVTLSIPDDLYKKLEAYRPGLNLSALFRAAVEKYIGDLEAEETKINNAFKLLRDL